MLIDNMCQAVKCISLAADELALQFRKVSVQPKGKGKSKPGAGSGASGKSKTAGKKKL